MKKERLKLQTKILKDIDNIAIALEEFSTNSGISLQNLTFKIQAFRTYMKKKEAEFFEILQDSELVDSDEIFECNDCDLRQSFDIVIMQKTQERCFDIRINNDFESLDLILYPSFIPPTNESQWQEFIDCLNALKAWRGIFLRNLKNERNIIEQSLQNTQRLQNEMIIRLYESKNFRDSTPAYLKYHITGINEAKNNIICAKENSLICEFYPAKNGVSGRNMRGIFLENPQSSQANQNPPILSDDFEKLMTQDCMKISNKKSGFVIFTANQFSFTQTLNLTNIKAKDNYNFIGDIDSQTNLVVSGKSEFDDAIQNGVFVMASNITINGNIGANVKIKANTLNITGYTHRDSTLEAKEATINVHRGYLLCQNAKIQTLENGNINGDELEILKANGGELVAQNITIRELYSNAIISFSRKCMLYTMIGGGNKITFTPFGDRRAKEKILALKQSLEQKTASQKEIASKIDVLLYQYKKFQNTAKDLEDSIHKANLEGKTPPSYIVENYNAFLEITHSLKNLKMQNLALEKDKKQLSNDLKTTQQNVFDAEFICKDGWLKYNDVIFEFIVPKIHSAKTIIKGAGRYYFDTTQKKIVYQKIFNDDNNTINNQGF